MNDINRWIEGETDYNVGLKILEVYHPDNPALALLRSGENSFTRNKLFEQILKLQSSLLKSAKPKVEDAPKQDVDSFKSNANFEFVKIDYEALPPELKEANKNKNALFKEANYWFIQMQNVDLSEEQRYEMAKKVLYNFDEISFIWKQLEDWETQGIRPERITHLELADLSCLALANKRNNLMKRFYKIKNDDKNDKSIELKNEIDQIERILESR